MDTRPSSLQTSQQPGSAATTSAATSDEQALKSGATHDKTGDSDANIDPELAMQLDKYSLEAIVDLKISRFLDQIGTYYPENLHSLIMKKVEKPLLGQILRRTGGNQVHASRILGINRNTLRKKMKIYGFAP